MKKGRLMTAVIVASLMAFGCTEEDVFANYETLMKQAQTNWENEGIEDYTYQFNKSVDHSILVMEVSVEAGELSDVRDLISGEYLPLYHEGATSINGLFDYIESIIYTMKNNTEVEVSELNIVYNDGYGYPSSIQYKFSDTVLGIENQEVIIVSSNLDEIDG